MRSRSYIIRVLLLFYLVVAAFLVFIFLVFFQTIANDGISDQAAAMRRYAGLMIEGITDAVRSGRPDAVQAFSEAKAGTLGARVTVVGPDGAVLADTEENPAYMENHAGRPEIRRALAGEENHLVRYSATLKKDMLYTARPIRDGAKVVGVLRLSMAMASLEQLLTGLKLQYLLVIGFLVAVSSAALLVIYFFFKKEIGRFSLISRQVAGGDFNVVFPGSESREVRELSRSFAAMVAKIRTLIADVTAEKNESESVIASVDEGIAVIDGDGVITRANAAFARLFDFDHPAGWHAWEVIRSNEITALLEKGLGETRRAVAVGLGEKTLLFSLSPLPERREKVLVFSDVTAVKNWETMKKDLAANITHELGTPLTAVKGYVETLLDEERDERKSKYLRIIARHTERLVNIVKDLLSLSRLEDGREAAPTERVSAAAALENVLPLFRERAAAKGLTLTLEAAPDLPAVTGDLFQLEQMFINLLDNAVKYTERGGIAIALSHAEGALSVEISDSGIGIPEKDLDRVFERFYVVDKSRSRTQGGTGLGLAIVKHIVAWHGGDIRVTSRPGAGTTFRLSFPIP